MNFNISAIKHLNCFSSRAPWSSIKNQSDCFSSITCADQSKVWLFYFFNFLSSTIFWTEAKTYPSCGAYSVPPKTSSRGSLMFMIYSAILPSFSSSSLNWPKLFMSLKAAVSSKTFGREDLALHFSASASISSIDY